MTVIEEATQHIAEEKRKIAVQYLVTLINFRDIAFRHYELQNKLVMDFNADEYIKNLNYYDRPTQPNMKPEGWR